MLVVGGGAYEQLAGLVDLHTTRYCSVNIILRPRCLAFSIDGSIISNVWPCAQACLRGLPYVHCLLRFTHPRLASRCAPTTTLPRPRYVWLPPPVPGGGRNSAGSSACCNVLNAYRACPMFFSAFSRRTPWRRISSVTRGTSLSRSWWYSCSRRACSSVTDMEVRSLADLHDTMRAPWRHRTSCAQRRSRTVFLDRPAAIHSCVGAHTRSHTHSHTHTATHTHTHTHT